MMSTEVPFMERVLDWHIQQSRMYVLQNFKSRAYAHLQLADKHINKYYNVTSTELKLKYALAKAASLAFIGLHADAVRTASDALQAAEGAAASDELEKLKLVGKKFIESEMDLLQGRQRISRPHTTSARGKREERGPSERPARTLSRPESRFVSSRPLSAPGRRSDEQVFPKKRLKLTDFVLDNEKDELRSKSRLSAVEYENQGLELTKKFSAAGLAASQKAQALNERMRGKSPEKTSVTTLLNKIKESHDQPIIDETLRELGISSKPDKRVDGSLVLNLQGLLMRQTAT